MDDDEAIEALRAKLRVQEGLLTLLLSALAEDEAGRRLLREMQTLQSAGLIGSRDNTPGESEANLAAEIEVETIIGRLLC